jgi:hypothetical protein
VCLALSSVVSNSRPTQIFFLRLILGECGETALKQLVQGIRFEKAFPWIQSYPDLLHQVTSPTIPAKDFGLLYPIYKQVRQSIHDILSLQPGTAQDRFHSFLKELPNFAPIALATFRSVRSVFN